MIIVYGKPECPYTRALIRKFKKEKAEFNYRDAESNTEFRRQMLAINGNVPHTPTVHNTETGVVMVGFRGH